MMIQIAIGEPVLLSIVSKVFTAVLNKGLYTWAEKEIKLGENRQGSVKVFNN